MKILIYSSMLCPYCFAAKTLLKKLNLKFEEVLVDNNSKVKKKMIELSDGRTSVPQIFFGENHVGGYDDLKRYYEEGKLNLFLKK
jgi:glutaredoxin 3|tara:strand:- start:105 stop:359 length:255 start_codon:yes stop_codon:yes gene_type:complete